MSAFFPKHQTSLKICGITTPSDAEKLAHIGVHALGLNFWPHSKRYCSPEKARTFSPDLEGEILRVGVFVNASEELILQCFSENLIDIAQFHGDETRDTLKNFSSHNKSFIRAIGLNKSVTLPPLDTFHTPHLLLDAHAPGVYGGTGETIDWSAAATLIKNHPEYDVLLAGGITPDNAKEACQVVNPCALDIASGAESSPGIKDFDKVKRLQEAITH